MYLYDGYHFGGMHLIWWFIWVVFLFTMFGWYQSASRKTMKENSPLDILQKRFAYGIISEEIYLKQKEILQKDLISDKFKQYSF